jgi:hypothetical protein
MYQRRTVHDRRACKQTVAIREPHYYKFIMHSGNRTILGEHRATAVYILCAHIHIEKM